MKWPQKATSGVEWWIVTIVVVNFHHIYFCYENVNKIVLTLFLLTEMTSGETENTHRIAQQQQCYYIIFYKVCLFTTWLSISDDFKTAVSV